MYRSPSFNLHDFIDAFTDFLGQLGDRTQDIILGGDLNINALEEIDFSVLSDICDTFNLRQLVDKPTHIQCAIDHLYIGRNLELHNWGLISPIEKHHATIYAHVKAGTTPRFLPICRHIWCYGRVDWPKFNTLLANAELSAKVTDAISINEAWNKWVEPVLKVAREAIPQKVVRKRHFTPWMTNQICRLIQHHDCAFHAWHRTNCNQKCAKYKRLRTKVKKEIAKEKTDCTVTSFTECKNPADFWKTVRNFTQGVHSFPSLQNENGTFASSDPKKPLYLQTSFTQFGTEMVICYQYFQKPQISTLVGCVSQRQLCTT